MAQNKNWKERLKKIKDYKAAKENSETVGATLEDGRYKAKLTSAELAESQTSGREQINMFFEVTEGENAGQKTGMFPGLDEKSLPFTLGKISRLGYELPEDPEDLVDIIEQIDEDKPNVILKVKGGWTDIDSVEEGETEGEPTSDDDATEEVTEETTEEEAEVTEGSKVSFQSGGKEIVATVTKILEDENKLIVETEEGKKLKVSAEKVSLLAEEETAEEVVEEEAEEVEEVEEEPKQKPKSKAKPVAKKPAPKGKVRRK